MLRKSDITLPFNQMAISLAYVVIPISVGILINKFLPKVAAIMKKFQRIAIPIFIILVLSFGWYPFILMNS